MAVAFDAENGKEPIPSFMVQGALGEVNATRLFVGRHVALVVMDPSCSGLDPFLSWRKRLSKEEVFQTHILCIGGQLEDTDASIFIAPNEAMEALGLTGTPMLLGIEDNSVQWRIAGFIVQWPVLASRWLEPVVKGVE